MLNPGGLPRTRDAAPRPCPARSPGSPYQNTRYRHSSPGPKARVFLLSPEEVDYRGAGKTVEKGAFVALGWIGYHERTDQSSSARGRRCTSEEVASVSNSSGHDQNGSSSGVQEPPRVRSVSRRAFLTAAATATAGGIAAIVGGRTVTGLSRPASRTPRRSLPCKATTPPP